MCITLFILLRLVKQQDSSTEDATGCGCHQAAEHYLSSLWMLAFQWQVVHVVHLISDQLKSKYAHSFQADQA